jgi:signal transduction histidine kinase
MNAFQHAAATRIETELIIGKMQFTMRIRDDGIGIDESMIRTGRSGHWGLQGMRERARALGGRLSIWSHAGAGTEVELVIPAKIAYAKHDDTVKRPQSRRFKPRRR